MKHASCYVGLSALCLLTAVHCAPPISESRATAVSPAPFQCASDHRPQECLGDIFGRVHRSLERHFMNRPTANITPHYGEYSIAVRLRDPVDNGPNGANADLLLRGSVRLRLRGDVDDPPMTVAPIVTADATWQLPGKPYPYLVEYDEDEGRIDSFVDEIESAVRQAVALPSEQLGDPSAGEAGECE